VIIDRYIFRKSPIIFNNVIISKSLFINFVVPCNLIIEYLLNKARLAVPIIYMLLWSEYNMLLWSEYNYRHAL